jgi:NTE family protein
VKIDIMLHMKNRLAIVFAGGGARGALQVGALRAIMEAGLNPNILVGTSIGACNAAFIALNGLNPQSIDTLEKVWRDTTLVDLLPSNYLWLTVRTLFNRRVPSAMNRLEDFLVDHGLSPDLTFGDIVGSTLLLVAADLNKGQALVFGKNPPDSILQGVLASTALPPWITPMVSGDQLLIDGGVISNLPLKTALDAGATEIIALDLSEPSPDFANPQGFGPFLAKLIRTVHNRQVELEIALADAHLVPVCHIKLCQAKSVPLWDFSYTEALIQGGYQIAQREISDWQEQKRQSQWPQSWGKSLRLLVKRVINH